MSQQWIDASHVGGVMTACLPGMLSVNRQSVVGWERTSRTIQSPSPEKWRVGGWVSSCVSPTTYRTANGGAQQGAHWMEWMGVMHAGA